MDKKIKGQAFHVKDKRYKIVQATSSSIRKGMSISIGYREIMCFMISLPYDMQMCRFYSMIGLCLHEAVDEEPSRYHLS